MRAVVVAGGSFHPAPHLVRLIEEADLLVAADRGAAALRAVGRIPHIAIGDFDSIDEQSLDWLVRGGCDFVRYPAAKDASDTELAVNVCLDRSADSIAILGATGGPRLDHLLANVLLLLLPAATRPRVTIVDDQHELFVLSCRDESRDSCQAVIRGRQGDLLTLLPLLGDATGLHTEGLEYPLHGGTLPLGSTLGLSNVMTGPVATVRLERGAVLVIHRSGGHEEGKG